MDRRIALKELKVDMTYQRAPEEKRIRKIAKAWDDMKANLVHVSHRPDGYYVIDGNHTRLACERTGRTDILCRIHEGLSREEEAHLFSELNTTNKKPSFNEILKARAAGGYELEKSYLNLLDKAGIGYVLSNSGAQGCVLKCHASLIGVYKKTARSEMLRALTIAKEAANGREEFYRNGFFPGLCLVVIYHPNLDEDRLINCVRKVASSKIMEIADAYKRGSVTPGPIGRTSYYYKAYVDIYNKGLRKNKIAIKE